MSTPPYDVERIREDFPILSREVHGRPLVYLDNAATTQKPRAVIDRISRYYAEENANVHRGVHVLSAEGTEAFEAARQSVASFIGAPSPREVVFTRGTTESGSWWAVRWAATRGSCRPPPTWCCANDPTG